MTWPLITVKSRTETQILEMPGAGPGMLDRPDLLKGARVTIFVGYPRLPVTGHVPIAAHWIEKPPRKKPRRR